MFPQYWKDSEWSRKFLSVGHSRIVQYGNPYWNDKDPTLAHEEYKVLQSTEVKWTTEKRKEWTRAQLDRISRKLFENPWWLTSKSRKYHMRGAYRKPEPGVKAGRNERVYEVAERSSGWRKSDGKWDYIKHGEDEWSEPSPRR